MSRTGRRDTILQQVAVILGADGMARDGVEAARREPAFAKWTLREPAMGPVVTVPGADA